MNGTIIISKPLAAQAVLFIKICKFFSSGPTQLTQKHNGGVRLEVNHEDPAKFILIVTTQVGHWPGLKSPGK